MKLKSLRLKNFGCYEEFELENVRPLAMIIGENDVGKSVLLEAIHTLCDPKRYSHDLHARKINADQLSEKVELEGSFKVEAKDGSAIDDFAVNGEVRVRHQLHESGITSRVYRTAYVDDRVENWSSLSADEEREVLKSLGVLEKDLGSNGSKRLAQLDQLKSEDEIPTHVVWREANPSTVAKMLPEVERIRSVDFDDPDNIVKTALRRVVRRALQQESEADPGRREDIAELDPVKELVKDELRQEIRKATDILRRHHSDLESVDIEPLFDFAGILSSAYLTVDTGDGLSKRLRSFGLGTKRRLWMGLLEWLNESPEDAETGSTIRLYDEPDVNLHYDAQRRLLDNIESAVSSEKISQSIVCTHSVTFIDRVPPSKIVLLNRSSDGRREPHQFVGDEAEEYSKFYSSIGSAMGLNNTSLLYEHAYLLVEGDSEVRALSEVYESLYGSTFHQDKVLLIPLDGCGAWRPVFKILLAHRQSIVHLLLDEDCQDPESHAKLTPRTFEDLGVSDGFISNNITFIGPKEFEGAFSNETIVRALEQKYPREDGQGWQPSDIESAREGKFSENLERLVRLSCVLRMRSRVSKPDIAEAIVNCCSEESLPSAIVECMKAVRLKADLEPNPQPPESNGKK